MPGASGRGKENIMVSTCPGDLARGKERVKRLSMPGDLAGEKRRELRISACTGGWSAERRKIRSQQPGEFGPREGGDMDLNFPGNFTRGKEKI